MLEPMPDRDESPQPALSTVNSPQMHTRAPARAALAVECLIAPRLTPVAATLSPDLPEPKPSTPNRPRPSALRRKSGETEPRCPLSRRRTAQNARR